MWCEVEVAASPVHGSCTALHDEPVAPKSLQMPLDAIISLVIGLVLLTVGAEALVRGASALAAAIGISPLVVGLTVVAYGTSAPELAVGVQASLAGQGDIAVGNVIGSNIFNILLILGLSAIVTPLVVARQLVRRDVPIMIAVSVVFVLMALDGALSRIEGIMLAAGAAGYTAFSLQMSRREQRILRENSPAGNGVPRPHIPARLILQFGLLLVGLGMLVFGARQLVGGAVIIARTLGVSELVIGLTIVAAGTSLPEVATSVMAAARGQRDIAVGNAIGSNIFNILLILGISGAVAPSGLVVAPALLAFDLPVMVAVAVACLPIFYTGQLIARWEGGLFLAYYGAYVTYVILAASQHDALDPYSRTMLWFVVPLTTVPVLLLGVHESRVRRAARRRER